jgi:hypothetical protein
VNNKEALLIRHIITFMRIKLGNDIMKSHDYRLNIKQFQHTSTYQIPTYLT